MITERMAQPADDDTLVERFHIDFAIPVFITQSQQQTLHNLIDDICRTPVNTPVGSVHWLAGWGAQPRWAEADARLLGVTNPDSVQTGIKSGEPLFDELVLHGESYCREKYF